MKPKTQHVCPWWLGYFLLNPLRKFYHNPEEMFKPYVKPGMNVIDYGCAMGYFTLPLARLVGETGHVYAIDIQKKMIDNLWKRATKAGLEKIIKPVLVPENIIPAELNNQINFVLLFAMVHEVQDQKVLFETVGKFVKTGGTVYFAEPKGHVSRSAFENSINEASHAGFEVAKAITISGSHAVVLRKV